MRLQIEVRIKSDNKDLDDLNNDKDIKASIDLDGKKKEVMKSRLR